MKIHRCIPFLFLGGVMPLCAEVSYVRDIAHPVLNYVVPTVKAPVDIADPLYDPEVPDTQLILTIDRCYPFDPAVGFISTVRLYPPSLKVDIDSLVMSVGAGTSAPTMLVWSSILRTLYTASFNNDTRTLTLTNTVTVALGFPTSFAAADRSNVTTLADGAFHSVNLTTGVTTERFTLSGGTTAGEFSADTRYHTYGPNGLVYFLDYGNNRMQMLDPANAFAYVSEFALETSVTTANMQFAIGPTGNIYLGDGLGGGSYYSADGTYIGQFYLPSPVTPDQQIGTPYVSTDASGGVYVFDNTGFHQYLDPSVTSVPEPATSGTLLSTALLGMALLRHRSGRAL